MSARKVAVELTGVAETTLWPLYNRAAAARGPNPLLNDPLAVELVQSIEYPFAERFGRPDEGHPLRALRFDEAIRAYLQRWPEATVVGLGEGLETQFWRVDNGTVRWLAVDVPEVIALRQQLLPKSPRMTNLACSVVDETWISHVDRSRGIFITAQGLLMYLQPAEVETLIRRCAEAFPGAEMLFDTIPQWFSRKTLRGFHKTPSYKTPPMPWGIDASDLASLKRIHTNVTSVRDLDIARGRGFAFRWLIPALTKLPILRDKRPAFALLTFGRRGDP